MSDYIDDINVNDYLYTGEIVITEVNGVDSTNFISRITLTPAIFNFALAQSDGSDLRIAEMPDGTKVLNIFTASWITSEEATVYLKLPSLRAGETKILYVFWGHATIPSISDIDSVGFLFHDHFEGTSINFEKWNLLSSTSVTVADSTAKVIYGNWMCTNNLPPGWQFYIYSSWGQRGFAFADSTGLRLDCSGTHSGCQVHTTSSMVKEGVITIRFKYRHTKDHYASATHATSIHFRNPSTSRNTSYGYPSTNTVAIYIGANGDTTECTYWSATDCGGATISIDEDIFNEIEWVINSDTREMVVNYHMPVDTLEDNPDLTVGGTPTTGDTGGYPITNLFDNSTNTMWVTLSLPQWIQYQFLTAERITKFRFYPRGGYPHRSPGSFTVLGSNTGIFSGEEIEIASITGVTHLDGKWTPVEFENFTSFIYYRVNITAAQSGGEINTMEMEMIEQTPLSPPVYTLSGTITENNWNNVSDNFVLEFSHHNYGSSNVMFKDLSLTTTSGTSLVESFMDSTLEDAIDWTIETKFRTGDVGNIHYSHYTMAQTWGRGSNPPGLYLYYAAPENHTTQYHRRHDFYCEGTVYDPGTPYTPEYDKGISYDSDHLMTISYSEGTDEISYHMKKEKSRFYNYKEYTDVYPRVCHGNSNLGQLWLNGPSYSSDPMYTYIDYVLIYKNNVTAYTVDTSDLYIQYETVNPATLSTGTYGPDLTDYIYYHETDLGGDPRKLSDNGTESVWESDEIYLPAPGDDPNAIWHEGSGVPDNSLGAYNDYYLDTSTENVYLKDDPYESTMLSVGGSSTGGTYPSLGWDGRDDTENIWTGGLTVRTTTYDLGFGNEEVINVVKVYNAYHNFRIYGAEDTGIGAGPYQLLVESNAVQNAWKTFNINNIIPFRYIRYSTQDSQIASFIGTVACYYYPEYAWRNLSNTIQGYVSIDFGRYDENFVSSTYTLDFEVPKKVGCFLMTAVSGTTSDTVKNFRFEGGNIDPKYSTEWFTLYSGTARHLDGWQAFYFVNGRSFRYYRLYVEDTYGGSVKVQEWAMYEFVENPIQLEKRVVSRVRLKPTKDAPGYFPKRIQILGSNGLVWTTLVPTINTYTPNNDWWQEFVFTSTIPYWSYKIIMTDNWAETNNKISIAEWTMHEEL